MDYRNSVYTGRLKDPEAVYLGSEAFPAYGDGIHDDTENLQYAVNYVKKNLNFGIVFLPEGKYLISDTVYMPQAVRLIGYGAKRPEIILQDHAVHLPIGQRDTAMSALQALQERGSKRAEG